MPPNHILLGRFGRAHGVKGEVRLQSFTADPLAIAGYSPLLSADGAKTYALASARAAADMLIVRVEGVTTREGADMLNGVELFAPRERLPPAEDEDEFLMADLVGCRAILPDGTVLGEIVGVANYGAGDLLDIRPTAGGPSVLMPFTRAYAPRIDIAGREVAIDPPAGLFGD
jgi:16S rRNA processing protein RimM